MTKQTVNLGIDEAKRKEIAKKLSVFLADTFSLYFKTHAFHWNVTGPHFHTLHLMLEEQYRELWAAVDIIAERIRALGEYSPSTLTDFLELSSLSETTGVPDADKMLSDLLSDHEKVIVFARKSCALAAESGDDASADLLTQRLQVHEKTAWMLRSFLEKN